MKPKRIDPASRVQASGQHMRAELDDATILLHLGSGQYFSLGGASGAIWELLQAPIRVSDLVAQLVARFDVDAARCETETLALLQRLDAEGLLTVHGD